MLLTITVYSIDMSNYYTGAGDGFQCETCYNTGGFYIQDGVTFCKFCGQESQQHGHEIVVDEESAVFHGER